jgi:hypothetical protein
MSSTDGARRQPNLRRSQHPELAVEGLSPQTRAIFEALRACGPCTAKTLAVALHGATASGGEVRPRLHVLRRKSLATCDALSDHWQATTTPPPASPAAFAQRDSKT